MWAFASYATVILLCLELLLGSQYSRVMLNLSALSSFSMISTDASSSIQSSFNPPFWMICCLYHSFTRLWISSRPLFVSRLLVLISRTAPASSCRARSTFPTTLLIIPTLCRSRIKATTPNITFPITATFTSAGVRNLCVSMKPSRCTGPPAIFFVVIPRVLKMPTVKTWLWKILE